MAGQLRGSAVARTLVVSGLFAVSISGCAGTHDAKADFAVLIHGVATSPASGSVYRPTDYTISTVIPGQRGDVSDSVVVGKISSVTHGFGYVLKDPPPSGEVAGRVDYDDPAAQWRNLHVTIDASETLAGPQMTTITIPWAVLGNSQSGEDAEAAARALKGLGRVVVFTNSVPPNLVSWDGLRRIANDRPYNVGTVDDHDVLHFPFINSTEGPSETAFLGDVTTLARLRAAAK